MKNNKESFVVVSDFHSNKWPLDKVKYEYLNKYDKIFILGDITDRGGPNNFGQGGLEMLIEVMNLEKKFPGRIVYVPGNHDSFLYDYGVYNDTHAYINMCRNGGIETANEIDKLKEEEPKLANELLEWLGSRPLQVIYENNGQKYCMAHAFFNERLYKYNKNLGLKDIKSSPKDISDAAFDVLWFRKGKNYNPKDVVSDDAIVVIGHTPSRHRENQNLNLINESGNEVNVICVDGGIDSDGIMHKFDGGKGAVETKMKKLESEHAYNKSMHKLNFDKNFVTKNSLNDGFYENSKNNDNIQINKDNKLDLSFDRKKTDDVYINDSMGVKLSTDTLMYIGEDAYLVDQEYKFKRLIISLLEGSHFCYSYIAEQIYNYIKTGTPVNFKDILEKNGIDSEFIYLHILEPRRKSNPKESLNFDDVIKFVTKTGFDYTIMYNYYKFNKDVDKTVEYIKSNRPRYDVALSDENTNNYVIGNLHNSGSIAGYLRYINFELKKDLKEYILDVIKANDDNKAFKISM